MNIVFIAQDNKKELMVELCIAYEKVFSEHSLYATGMTAKTIMENTGLKVNRFLPGNHGGVEQIGMHITYNDVDMLIYLRSPMDSEADAQKAAYIMRLCDMNSVPFATNIATAEVLIHGLERGDLDWRDIVNPKER